MKTIPLYFYNNGFYNMDNVLYILRLHIIIWPFVAQLSCVCVCKMWLGRNVGSTQPRIPRLNVYECMYDKSSNNKIKNSIVLHKSSLISGINRGVYTRMVSICRVINFIYIRLGKLLYHDIVLIGTMTPNRFRNCDSCKQAFDVYTLCCCRCNQRLTADIWDNREQTLPTWLKPLLWR